MSGTPTTEEEHAPGRERRKGRVLACAYACAPPGSPTFHGGEELLGWRIVEQIGRFRNADVLVSGEHRRSIERAEPVAGVRFRFVDLPRLLRPLREVQGGIQLYAYLWQVKAAAVAARLHRRHGYRLFHHVTYANDWMASHAGAILKTPFVRGPGGGAHHVPEPLLRSYDWRFRLTQRLRSALQRLLRMDPFFIAGRRHAAAILVCTREAMEVLPPAARSRAEMMPVVGVTEEDFEVESDADEEGHFTILMAGKLLRHKGFDLGLRAFSRTRGSSSGAGATLVVAGRGPEGDRLRNLSARLGVEGDVRWEGWMERDGLLQSMADADVFLFPSLRDGGGAVVVEAMAAGTPVVCLDVAGPGVHVTSETGVKVEPAEPDAVVSRLAGALDRLRAEPALRRELGRKARRRAWSRYRWSRHGERIDRLYRRVLAEDAAPAAETEREVVG